MTLLDHIRKFLAEADQLKKKPLLVVLGPTASGKTALSIQLAKIFHGEIISADSRQVYKYMDIGTDKIPESKMEGVPHHLLSVVEPNQEFTLSDFKRLALKAINEIQARQKLPILCGGTGLYINAVVDNYMIPQIPPQYDLRQKLAQYYEEHGENALHELLKEKDPQAAEKIHPHNIRYVIRALEINMVGGERKNDQKGEPMFHVFSVGIEWPREVLYERINGRAQDQIDRGLLNEVKMLLMKGYDEKLASMSSLGYLELIDFLRGHATLDEAIESIKKNTRNYCKRQLTWFRRYKNIKWISPEELNTILNIQA